MPKVIFRWVFLFIFCYMPIKSSVASFYPFFLLNYTLAVLTTVATAVFFLRVALATVVKALDRKNEIECAITTTSTMLAHGIQSMYIYTTALYATRGVLEAHCCWVITRVYVVRAQHSFLSVLFQLSSNSFRCERKKRMEMSGTSTFSVCHLCGSYVRYIIVRRELGKKSENKD